MSAKGDQGTVRALNRRLLLRLLREQGPTSRTDLAELSGLSNGAITRIVGELIDEGFLVERSVGASTGGRRPVLLDLDTSVRVVAGLKVMDDEILAVLVDIKGAVVANACLPLHTHSVDAVLDRCGSAVTELLASAAIPRDQLSGIGLCMPGSVDWRAGVCRLSPFFGWVDVPVAELFSDRMGVPVFIDNDVNALAVAESLFGSSRQVRDFAVVTVGRGVGAGLVCGGRVYRGSSGGAGEFGHAVSQIGGRRCECGKTGCLEAYVGDHAVLGRVHELGGRYARVDVAEFVALARADDPAAAGIYAEVTERLGVAIANLINLFDPQLVVIGGEAAYLTEAFVADVRRHIDAHAFGGLDDHFELQLDAERGDRTRWARGAASLAMEHMFDPLIKTHDLAIA
ncbi:MAG TPA: ROK family transcriptional regulator [Micromonosporaceae bacterium]|jgi:predicted NBD/HSP70 family sugar kinase|nr:ROK family transcriptional regulator [Micromonosporaceae bacterium]